MRGYIYVEILAIIVLANKNAKNAVSRGRKPGGFRGMTLGLWFGGELIGFIIGMAATDGETLAAYGAALLLAIAGGIASYVAAKTCKPGDYRELQPFPVVHSQEVFTQAPPQYGGAARYLPERPERALWVMGGAILFMLLSAFLFLPELGRARGYNMTIQLLGFCFPLLLSAGIYLMRQSIAKYKIFSGAGMILGTVLYAISSTSLTVYGQTLQYPPLAGLLGSPQFGASLRSSSITTVVIGAIALIIAVTNNGRGEKKLTLSAWISAAALFLLRMFYARHIFISPVLPFTRKIWIVVEGVGDAGCLVLFVLLIYMLCTLKEKELDTGVGVKIWFCLCALFTVSGVVLSIANAAASVAEIVIALAGIIGCVLLLLSKRIGFPILLTAVLMNVASGVCAGLTGGQPSVFATVIPLVGLVNPLITWLLIRKEWTVANDPH